MSTQDRIPIQIVKSTPKAHLVADSEGRQGWIQKRWLGADNTVAAATFDKAVANQIARQADFEARQADQAAERAFCNAMHAVPVARQSERAVAAEVVVELGGCRTPRLVWFCKSQCGNAGRPGLVLVPGWLIRAKEREECEGYRGSSYYERHRYCKGEPVYLAEGVRVVEIEPPTEA